MLKPNHGNKSFDDALQLTDPYPGYVRPSEIH